MPSPPALGNQRRVLPAAVEAIVDHDKSRFVLTDLRFIGTNVFACIIFTLLRPRIPSAAQGDAWVHNRISADSLIRSGDSRPEYNSTT